MRPKNITQTLAAAATLCALAGNTAANAAQTLPGEAGIVPKPAKLEIGAGAFPLSPRCQILYQRGSPGAKAAAEYLADAWQKALGSPFAGSDGR